MHPQLQPRLVLQHSPTLNQHKIPVLLQRPLPVPTLQTVPSLYQQAFIAAVNSIPYKPRLLVVIILINIPAPQPRHLHLALSLMVPKLLVKLTP